MMMYYKIKSREEIEEEKQIKERVHTQEKKYREFANAFFQSFNLKNLQTFSCPDSCNIDFQVTGGTATYDIEIKERNLDTRKFNCAILKERKFNLMENFHEYSGNDKLMYMVIINKSTVYLFNLDKGIDNYKHFLLRCKHTQFSNSRFDDVYNAVEIPLDSAIYSRPLTDKEKEIIA